MTRSEAVAVACPRTGRQRPGPPFRLYPAGNLTADLLRISSQTYSTPAGPMTATRVVGRATTKSAPTAEAVERGGAAVSIAHQHQKRGVRKSTIASSMARPACTIPPLSCSLPGRKPVVSSRKITGILYKLQKRMKRAFCKRRRYPGRGHRRVVGDKPDHIAAHPTSAVTVLRARSGWISEVAVIAKLLDKNGDIDGRVEACGELKAFLEQDIDVPGFAGDRVGTGLVRRQFTVIAGQVVEQRTLRRPATSSLTTKSVTPLLL